MLITSKRKPNKGKEMIQAAVPRKPGEPVKTYLYRVSQETRLGYWRLVQCWHNRFSNETEVVLTEVANNEDNISLRMQELLALAEATSNHACVVNQDHEVRNAFRDLVEQARSLDRRLGKPSQGKVMKFAIAFAVAASAFLVLMPTET